MRSTLTLTLMWLPALQAAPTPDLEAALSRLESWKPGDTWTKVSESSATIRSQTAVGDRAVWERLSAIMTNPELPREVRAEALGLACTQADQDIAAEIVSLVSSLLSSRDGGPQAREDRRLLISVFLSLGIDNVEAVTVDHAPIIAFLKTVARSDALVHYALEELAESPAPIEMRRAAVLEIIIGKPTLGGAGTGVGRALRTLLDESTFPTLRDLVRASTGPNDFHYAAAGALAHFGDKEFLALLDELRGRFPPEPPYTRLFHLYAWKINAQDPPSKLLECIASADPTHDPPNWCVDRAVEVGLGKEDIRQAILTFAARVHPDARGVRRGLASIKRRGLRLGVLEAGDLPDVRIPPRAKH